MLTRTYPTLTFTHELSYPPRHASTHIPSDTAAALLEGAGTSSCVLPDECNAPAVAAAASDSWGSAGTTTLMGDAAASRPRGSSSGAAGRPVTTAANARWPLTSMRGGSDGKDGREEGSDGGGGRERGGREGGVDEDRLRTVVAADWIPFWASLKPRAAPPPPRSSGSQAGTGGIGGCVSGDSVGECRRVRPSRLLLHSAPSRSESKS